MLVVKAEDFDRVQAKVERLSRENERLRQSLFAARDEIVFHRQAAVAARDQLRAQEVAT